MADDDRPAGRPRFRPVHPGRIVKRNIDALGITVEAFADHIGTSRQTVHAIIAGRSMVTPEMAARLGRAFSNSPQFWLNMQANHVLWELDRLKSLSRIRPLRGLEEGVLQNFQSGAARPRQRRPKVKHN
jgi:antitoxin HigA-1